MILTVNVNCIGLKSVFKPGSLTLQGARHAAAHFNYHALYGSFDCAVQAKPGLLGFIGSADTSGNGNATSLDDQVK